MFTRLLDNTLYVIESRTMIGLDIVQVCCTVAKKKKICIQLFTINNIIVIIHIFVAVIVKLKKKPDFKYQFRRIWC